MSSGSGKNKLVAAAVSPSPLSVSIAANPVSSEAPTGIKLLIDKNRIVSVPSTKTQHIVVQRQSQVVNRQNASLSQSPANDNNLRIASSNAGNSTVSFKTAPPGTQKVLLKIFTPTTTDAEVHGSGGEMRVKVTGDDMNRNGQPTVSGGGGQLQQLKVANNLLSRRISIHRRLPPVPTSLEPDSNNGQQTAALYTKPVRLADEQSLLKHNITSNNAIKSLQHAPTMTTTAIISSVTATAIGGNLVPFSTSNTQSLPAGIVVDISSDSNVQINQDQCMVSSKNNQKNGKDGSTGVSAHQSPLNKPVNEETGSEAVVGKVTHTAQEISADEIQPAGTMETGEDGNDQSKQPIPAAAPTTVAREHDDPGSTILNTGVLGEVVVSKPSREMKSLQVMQAKSKVLSEFITETISKGKLRKRRSDSNVDAADDASISPTRTQTVIPPRKRNRRRSTVLTLDADNANELATDGSHNLEDLVKEMPATRVRKIRSVKSEYALQKGERQPEALSGGASFFSSLNLQHESNKSIDESFPGDPPKPGWDRFCWRCKKSDPDVGCSSCIRSYHKYCVRYSLEKLKWNCTECKMAKHESTDVESFTTCLGYLVNILLLNNDWNGSFNPIDKSLLPNYDKYITRHIDLAIMNELQSQRAYKSSQEFLTDVGWIVHNMSIYPDKLNLLKRARSLQKRAKQEIDEMEPCYECYMKANTLCEDWFREPCSKPHLLVWAKMKGYPYWPGKLYVVNSNNQAFVRFFGSHDRSWMSVKECYLFSERDPNPPKQCLKSKLLLLYATSVEDIAHHITRLREKFKTFNYGSFMEAVDPSRFEEQQRAMFPGAFLKKVKVTIKRSEGEMVAVASTAADDAAQATHMPDTKVSKIPEKDPAPARKSLIKKVTPSSPRKRMTRRMSRFLKSSDDLTSSPKLTEGSQHDLMAPSSTSLLLNTDKALEIKQASNATTDESKEFNADDSDCNPKNLSLLLRRGSQSWETEPLSKRRKSVIEKGTLVSGVGTKEKPSPIGAKAKEALQMEAVVKSVDEKTTEPQNVLIDKSVLVSVAPTKTKSTTTVSKGNEPLQKEAVVEPISEKAIVPQNVLIDKTILASVASPKTKSTVATSKAKCVSTTIGPAETKDAVEPVAEKVTPVSSNVLMEKNSTSIALTKTTNNVVGTDNVIQHSLKNATTESQPVHTQNHTNVANSSVVVSIPSVTTTIITKPCAGLPKSTASLNATTVCTIAAAAASSDTGSKATDASSSAFKLTSTKPADIDIKKEIISDDEVKIVECPQDVMPAPIKEPIRTDNSTSSASLDVIKKQHITSPISAVNEVKPVQQTPPAVLPISSTTITMVTSNQRARKSFPGGASNTKHVTSKQAASLVHNVSLPATITIPSASHQQTLAHPTQPSLNTPMNATVSIPKELVTPSTVMSLIPCIDDRKNAGNDVIASSLDSNDNDDVLIIEEEPRTSSVPSRGRKIDGNNQLPPPLVPRPPETSLSLPSDDDSTIELNRTMQLFDESSNKVLDHIRLVMEDMLKDMSGNGSSLAELATLKLNQERQQELWLREKEKQQNAFDSRLAELRISLEQEKNRALNEQRQQLVREKQRAVQSTKMKQWCKKCFSEAHYYCCWNTSYCSAACQKKHWLEHKTDCAQEHANNARSVQCTSTVTNSMLSSDSNNSSSTSTTNSHMRSRSCLQISAVPSAGGGDANNLTHKRSPNNRVFPSEITSTSTPLQTPVRFITGTLASNVSYKTPVIQSVHGRDGMIINLPSHSPQNGGNATLGMNTSVTTSTPQQLMQKRAAARDKSNQLNHQKVDSRNKGYAPRKTYDITSSPYQNTNNLLTSTTSTIVPSAASSYATVTLSEATTVSGGSASVWNQVAMLQPSGNRQVHSGTSYATTGGVTPADGAEKGYLPVEFGIRQTHPNAVSLAQQQKMAQQQASSAYMRHQQ